MGTSSNVNRLAIILAMILIMPCAAAEPVMGPDIPETADAAGPVWIFVNITSEPPINTVTISYQNTGDGNLFIENMELAQGNTTSGTWRYGIPAQNYQGTLEISILATDISGSSSRYPATGSQYIALEGPEKKQPFPWNLVLIVGFLAVALIGTELLIKPGLYRKTGRQRARELEEQDRIDEKEQLESDKEMQQNNTK